MRVSSDFQRLTALYLVVVLSGVPQLARAQQPQPSPNPEPEKAVVVNPELGGLHELESPPPGSAAAEERDTLWRDRLYRDQLIQAWIKNPDLYDTTRRMLREQNIQRLNLEHERLKSRGNNLQILEDISERVPGVGGVVAEDFVRGVESFSNRRNERLRREMLDNMDRVQALAERIRELAYAAESGGSSPQHEVAKKLTNPQLGDTPRPVASLEAMKAQTPDAAAAAERAGLNDETIARMTPEDLRNLMREELPQAERQQIVDRYQIRIDVKQEIQNILVLSPDDLKTPAEREREQTIQEIRYTSQEMHGGLVGFTSLLGLSDPKAARDVQRVGEAAIDIYTNVAMMAAAGLTATGVGAVIAAVIVIITVLQQQQGQSIEQAIHGALQDVLKNQALMIEKLNEIDFKVDLMRAHLLQLQGILEMNHEEMMREFGGINERLTEMQASLTGYIGTTQQEAAARQWMQDTQKYRALFENREGSRLYNALIACHQLGESDAGCTAEARVVLVDIRTHLEALFLHATRSIRSEQTFTLPPSGKRNLQILLSAEALTALETRAEERIGYLPYMAAWLIYNGSHHRPPTEPLPVGSTALDELAHPGYLANLIHYYVSLAILLPPEDVKDENLPALCRQAMAIESASRTLRRQVPMAIAVYERSVRRVIAELDRHLDAPREGAAYSPPAGLRGYMEPVVGPHSVVIHAPQARVIDIPPRNPDEYEPPRTHVEHRHPRQTRQFIERMAASASPQEFIKLGVTLKIWERDSTRRRRDERDVYETRTKTGGRDHDDHDVSVRVGREYDSVTTWFVRPTVSAAASLGASRSRSLHYRERRVHKVTGGRNRGERLVYDRMSLQPQEERLYFTELIIAELERRYAELAKSWRDEADSSDVLHDLALAALTVDTFLVAGYGECGSSHPDFQDTISAWHQAIREQVAKAEALTEAATLGSLIDVRNELVALLDQIPPSPDPEPSPVPRGCSMGMGEQLRWRGMFTLASFYEELDPGPACSLVEPLPETALSSGANR